MLKSSKQARCGLLLGYLSGYNTHHDTLKVPSTQKTVTEKNYSSCVGRYVYPLLPPKLSDRVGTALVHVMHKYAENTVVSISGVIAPIWWG